MKTYLPRPPCIMFCLAMVATRVSAQIATEPEKGKTSPESTVRLSPFTVNESGAKPYLANESTAATRVAIPLQRIPQNITTLTGELLEDLNVTGSDEALYYAGAERLGFQDTGVSIRSFRALFEIDNMTWGTDIRMDSIIWDRLDVAKGPSGTMFGVGTPGGAINVITKKPKAESMLKLRAVYGSRGSYRLEGDATGAIDPGAKWRYRVSAARDHRVSDLLFGETTLDTIMPQIAWHPTRKTAVNVQLLYQNTPEWHPFDERFPTYSGLVQPPNPNFPPRNAVIGFVPGVPEYFNIPGPHSDRHNKLMTFTATWFQEITDDLSMNVAYRHSRSNESRLTRFLGESAVVRPDGSVANPNLRVGNWFQEKEMINEMIQADLNYNWSAGNALSGNFDGGANYSGFDQDNLIFWDIGGNGQPNPPLGNRINIFNPSSDPGSPDWTFLNFKETYTQYNWDDEIVHSERASTWVVSNTYFASQRGNVVAGWRRSYALGGANHNLAGSRYSYRRAYQNSVGGRNLSLDTFMAGGTFELLRKEKNYLTAFFGYSQSKDFNRVPFEPRSGTGGEGGLRFSGFREKVAASISYFDLTQSNIPRNDPNKGNELTISGEERAKGFELDLFYYPFRGATLFLMYVKQDTEIVSNVQIPYVEGNPAGDGGAYKTALNGAFTYRMPQGIFRNASATLGFIHRDEVAPFPSDASLWAVRLPQYTVFNLNVSVPVNVFHRLPAYVEFGVKNLTDKFYFTGSMIPGERRTFFGGASIRF